MKKITILITILLTTFMQLQSQDNVTTVSSAISNVTVFLRGAEIQREGSASLKTGAQQIVFENLPQDINPQSIQVAGTGNFTILGVSHKINHLKPAEKSKEVEDLEKSLKELQDNIALQQYLHKNLEEEGEMLKKNASIGGSQTGVNIDDLKKFSDYFHSRLTELTKSKVEINLKLRDMTTEMTRIQNQLQSLKAVSQKVTSSVIVEVTAQSAVQAKFSITYLVYSAGWSASYDLRAVDVNNPVELTYKANVYQSTGEDWKNIKPVFSTANPTVNNTKPELHPWYLSFYKPAPVSNYQAFNAIQGRVAGLEVKSDEILEYAEMRMKSPAPEALSTADLTTVQENQTSVEFIIDIPYTIPSDGQEHAVELAKHSLPAVYEYYAVRKLDKDVFLLAKVTGWEKLNLLSGEANVFFEGKFVGESHVETRQTDDILTLSLGRDKNITITRIRKRDYAEKQFLGSNITETREWDLTVHNKKKQPITIIVEDQIPISTEKEIKVEEINISNAIKDIDTGKLTWKLNLKPSESQSMNVKYTVKYPKNKKVILE
jgi:uncharacterized protein (TIGR02231 family)